MRKLYKLLVFLSYLDHSANKGNTGESSSKCHTRKKEVFGHDDNKNSIKACAQLSLRESRTATPQTVCSVALNALLGLFLGGPFHLVTCQFHNDM